MEKNIVGAWNGTSAAKPRQIGLEWMLAKFVNLIYFLCCNYMKLVGLTEYFALNSRLK